MIIAMIERRYKKNDAQSLARYSDCERFRYILRRIWDNTGKRVNFVMLNPSTATEVQNDPTVERCERRARALGFGSFMVTNIFAYRATDPRDMRAQSDPIGKDNDAAILQAADWADQIVCAWGIHGAHLKRGAKVAALLHAQSKPLYHLGLSQAGHPKHPLYLSYQTKPMVWL